MKDPKAIRKAIMTAKSIAAMVDPHFARVPLPELGAPAPDMAMPEPQQFATGGDVGNHVVNNPMSVFPKPQRMWDGDMPGGAYLSMPDKADVTGHKAAQASIGIGEGGKPYFHASRDEVDETGTPGKGSALVKTNLFKQKAGWRWLQAPEGHEGTGTIVSVEHRGNHHYVLDAHFPNGVELSRYPDAPSEPRLRPTTRGSVELGPQVGSILVRGREHPVHSHAIVREYGGRVGYADGGMPDDDRQANLNAFLEGNHPAVPRVVYHGTDRNISEFDTEKPRRVDAGMNSDYTDTGWYGKGHYFTPHTQAASHFASNYRVGEGSGPNVMPVHLSLKNPFIVKVPRSSSGAEAMDAAMNAAGFPQSSDDRLIRKGMGERLPSEQTQMLMDAGHDGVVVMHQYGIKDPEEERAAEQREQAAWERHSAAKNAFYDAPFENASNGAEIKALKEEYLSSRREYHAAKEAAGGEYNPHELVVFKPHQVKSAIGNSGRYDPNEAHIGRATGGEVDAPDYAAPDDMGLYSHAAATAASLPQAKASPAEFRGMLANRGVKPSEFEASGYDKAFAPAAGANRVEPITREQVAAHFNDNRTPIVEKSFRTNVPESEMEAFREKHINPLNDVSTRLSEAYAEAQGNGVNLRENPTEEYRQLSDEYRRIRVGYENARQSLQVAKPHHERWTLPGGENYREVLLKHGGDDTLFGGNTAHFKGEPNILAHLLMSDRTDEEGKRVLHLDELQSDWAQQARKIGFREPVDEGRFHFLSSMNADQRSSAEQAEYAEILKKRKGVSSGPYIKNTNDWVDLGLKRALTEAAKSGHDKLAWTPGQTAADRYQLSKYVTAIHHEKNEDGTYNLRAMGRNGGIAYSENRVPEGKMEETLGKEIASKIASGEGIGREEAWAKVDAAKKEYEEFKDRMAEADLGRRLANRRELEPDANWTEERRREIKDILKEHIERDPYTHAQNHGFGEEHDTLHGNLMDARHAMKHYAQHRDWRALSGLDLQVGGEGMRKFYDEMVPKRLMALVKKHDPEAKFSTSTVRHPESHDDNEGRDSYTDLHALEITPRMRESILKKGFPAYASGGEVDAPDDQMPIQPRPNPMAGSFAAENTPSVTVSPRPGKMGGYPVRAGTMGDAQPWTYATPQGEDQPMPPPVQHPVFNEPRMSNIHEATHKIFKSKGFNDLTEELTGLRNFKVKPIIGTWKGEIEPSFHISHPDMTPDAAEKLSHLLGFGFMQDAAVKGMHNPNPESEGIPSVYMGHSRKLSRTDLDRIHEASRQEGLDFSQTSDGRGVKFMHFGDEGEAFDKFAESAKRIQQKTGLPHIHHVNTSGDLNYAQDYLKGIFGQNEGEAGELGDLGSATRPSDLFGRVINHVVAPYAKAVAAEGYRLSPDRLRDTYGLSDQEHEQVRKALLPGSKDRTVIPLMEGTESLDVRPTGDRGKATVGDALFALQNRAAAHGQIEPGDFSKEAMEKIAKDIAKEVDYHVNTADKSAIGWYDAALKKAMTAYEGVFPELKNDDEKRMLFHAILGITSQGNDVHSNSVHTARLYNLLRNGEMSMPEGVEKLKGTFGDKTRAIEQNLLKFHHLVDANGHDAMRDLFGQKKTVSEWNKILRDRPELRGPDGSPLSMQGGANQKVTGWTVFGPKIGSFINNLSGDYSTLTADLWFSRTWNRLLGHNFIHTPLTEAKQYQDFRDALVAEHAHHNPDQALDEAAAGKTSNGQVTMKNGVPAPWEHGKDVAGMGRDEVDSLINDPDKMLETAKTLAEKYRKGGYKDKSDLRRRAKNWVENRELPVAAPRGNSERDFQQNTVERAKRILKNQYGKDISVADIQAALWFLEKDLFGKMGVASEKAAPADYADAAHNTINLINNGALYNVKSRPGQAEPVAKAYGGVVRKALAVASMPQGGKIRSALMIAKGMKKS